MAKNIRDKVRHLYCENNGRPAVDPVLLFKMLFIGYLFGVRSERQLVREVQVNVAYRWFLGLSLTDNIIDASTFSQQRRRRFLQSHIEQQIFDGIVHQAIEHGLVGGDVLYTDSTHMKANVNKKKFAIHTVTQTPTDYLTALESAIAEDRIAHGKAPLKNKAEDAKPKEREIKVSTTDPDSGYLTRDGKPQGFYYLDHRTVDGKHNIITYARYRGLRRVSGQCLLAAACQNMKKIALLLARCCYSQHVLMLMSMMWFTISGFMQKNRLIDGNSSTHSIFQSQVKKQNPTFLGWGLSAV